MKLIKLLAFCLFFLLHSILAQTEQPPARLNFLVSPKLDHFDAAPFSFQVQAKLMQMFHKKKMYVIIAKSSEDMASQIIAILEKRKAVIGNIWFDSHGHFTRRKSLFEIGKDEFNYMSICLTVLGCLMKQDQF